MNIVNIKIPVAIIISVIVLAATFYAVQHNKQQSIERQQLLQLEQDNIMEAARAEQSKKEYVAGRKTDCLDIYKTESDRWNNVRAWRYSEEDDLCYIRYKESTPKSDAKCDELYPIGGDLGLIFFNENVLCKDGEFENSF